MEPEERDIKQELRELLASYDIDVMDTPFKEWFQRAIEQEMSGGWGAFTEKKDSRPKEKYIVDKNMSGIFKVGDLVKRRSIIGEEATGIVTRVDEVATIGSHGRKYLVTFQQDGKQTWLNEDQLAKVE